MKNIKAYIKNKAIKATNEHLKFKNWFNDDNPCLQHHVKVLDIFLTVLLKKHCLWRTHKISSVHKLHPKLKIINE